MFIIFLSWYIFNTTKRIKLTGDIELDKNIIAEIFEKQKQYFKSGKTLSYAFRKNSLLMLKKMINENAEKLQYALCKDYKKPHTETYLTEIAWVLSEIDYTLKKLNNWMKRKKIKTSLFHFPASSYIIPQPYGNALIISPWNYPIQLALSPLIGAIAAGNCVVLKPSEFVPNTSALFVDLFREYFDEPYITVINGAVFETQVLLSMDFDYVFFTGSPAVGKIVMEKCSQNLVPVTLELGGKSPCIVCKDINVKVTARRIAWGKFTNAGQTCIAPDYLFVHKKVKNELIREIESAVIDFFPPDIEESDEYSRIVNEKHFNRIVSYIKNADVIFGGQYNASDYFIAPTLINQPDKTDDVMCDEIFGPVLPVFEFEDIEEVMNYINSGASPLALYVFTKDNKTQDRIIRGTRSGGMSINSTMSHFLSHKLPFGGVGRSGIGMYHGKYSFDTFSHFKSVMKKSFKFDMRMKYQPYKKRFNLIKKMVKWMF